MKFSELYSERPPEVLQNWRLLVYGPPKVGKTVLGVTASEHFPLSVDALKNIRDLKTPDLLFVEFDENGADTLAALNIEAPVLNVAHVSGQELVDGGITDIVTFIARRVKKGETRTVIIDTVSAFDIALLGWAHEKWPSSKHLPKLYGDVLAQHIKLFAGLKSTKCNILVLSHAHYKFQMDENDSNQKVKRKAESMASTRPGDASVIPQITGRAGRHYAGSTSIQMPMLSGVVGREVKRTLYPYGLMGFEGGCRYPNLNEKEPAHIGLLIQKVKEHMKAAS